MLNERIVGIEKMQDKDIETNGLTGDIDVGHQHHCHGLPFNGK